MYEIARKLNGFKEIRPLREQINDFVFLMALEVFFGKINFLL